MCCNLNSSFAIKYKLIMFSCANALKNESTRFHEYKMSFRCDYGRIGVVYILVCCDLHLTHIKENW